jgi:hypothetical protein
MKSPLAPPTSEVTQYTVAVENKMMKDQRPVANNPSIRSLQTMQLSGGDQNIFGNDDAFNLVLRRYYPDEMSLTGWSLQNIPLPGIGFLNYTIGYESDGTPRLFVLVQTDNSPGAGVAAAVYEIPLAADGTPAASVLIASFRTDPDAPGMLFSPVGPALFWTRHYDAATGGDCYLSGVWGEKLDQLFTPIDGAHTFGVSPNGQLSLLEIPGATASPNFSVLVQFQNQQSVICGTQFTPGATLSTEVVLPPLTDSNNQPVAATSFSTTSDATGRRTIYATIGDGRVRALSGVPDPGVPGNVLWEQSWNILDLGTWQQPQLDANGQPIIGPDGQPVLFNPISSDMALQVCASQNGQSGLALLDGRHRLWFSQQNASMGPWSRATPASDNLVYAMGAFIDDEGDFGVSLINGDQFISCLTRDASEDWEVESIDVGAGTTVGPMNVYRVGIIAYDQTQAAAADKAVTIAADDEIVVFVNGHVQYLSRDEPFTVTTDSDGAIWMMVDIVNSLAVPTFSLSSSDGIFDDQIIVIKPEAEAQTYTTKVTAEILRAALDDQGQPLLPADSPFADIAANLNKLGNAVAHIYSPLPYSSERLVFPGRAGVRVLRRREDWDETPASAGCWSMTKADGKLTFEEHTPETAAARRATLIARVAAERGIDTSQPDFDPNSLWDDFVDTMEDIGDFVISVGDAVISAGMATISFVVDGVSRIVEAALDAISVIGDVIKAVLDFAGAILGRVVGWLIRAVGWLLGLPDLIAIKNTLKDRIIASVAALTTTIPDPANSVASVQQQIQQWQTDFSAAIQSFKSTPSGSEPNSQNTGPLATLLQAMTSSGGNSVLAETSWVIEKLKTILPKIPTGLPDAPDFGVAGPLNDLLAKATAMGSTVQTFISNVLAAGLQSWLESLASLNSANCDPILDAINNQSAALLQNADAMVGDFGAALHAVWAHPEAITKWLDEPIDIPFFSAFYEGLVDHEFTILDFLALAAAVPYSLLAPSDVASAKDAPDGDSEGLFWTTFSLLGIRSVLLTLSAGFQMPASGPGAPGDAPVVAFLDWTLAAVGLFTSACMLAASVEEKDAWFAFGIIGVFEAAMTLLIIAFKARSAWLEDGLVCGCDLLALLSNLLVPGGLQGTAAGYIFLDFTQALSHLAVDRGKWPVNTPGGRGSYMILQGAASITQAALYASENTPPARIVAPGFA